MIETETECPYCGEDITVFVDGSVDEQSYIEDCSVCCRPIQVRARCQEGELLELEASRS